MSRTHQSRTEWLERQRARERPPEPEPWPKHAKPRSVTPETVRAGYERLYLRCPLCGWVAFRPSERPHHLAAEHGWVRRNGAP